MSRARKILQLPAPLEMFRGGVLPQAQMAYETWGEARGDNHIAIFTGLSPDAHAASSAEDSEAGWWEAMMGPGKAIDTDRFHVICFNSIGSCFGSTGPASVNPATGERWGLDFPLLSIEDTATAAGSVLDALGIDKLKAIVGPSMGGMSALAFALKYPRRVEHLITISSAMAAEPYAIAVRSLQRELIRSDAAWEEGRYAADAQPIAGMQLARKLGMTTYRSAREWRERFGRQRVAQPDRGEGPGRAAFPIEFEVEAYLQATADKFVGGFDANCYQYLSRAMDLFDVAEHGGGETSRAFANLELASALVVGVETDALFPVHQQLELANSLRGSGASVHFERLSSIQGHDAFLVDMDRFVPVVRGFLDALS